MNTDTPKPTTTQEGWDTFWRSSADAAFSAAGLHHPVVVAFWNKYFLQIKDLYDQPRIIDLASGSGAVVDRIHYGLGNNEQPITCVDVSQAAIDRLTEKYAGITGVVADAENIPLSDAMFDIATSQFGIEYAGVGAIPEACRLISDNGHIAFVMHHRDGAIYRDCSNNLAAIERTQESRFIPLAIDLFEAGFKAVAGGDRAPYDEAGTALSPAVRKVETILQNYGSDVADGTVAKLYNDIGQIHSKMPQYQPDEVLEWLRRTEAEIDAYAARMRSMCNSAMTEEVFDDLCDTLRSNGFEIELSSALGVAANQPPLAWALVANRGPAIMGDALTSGAEEVEKIEAWNQAQIQEAVSTVAGLSSYKSPVLEARVVWSLPMTVAVCQVREMGSDGHFHWAISGDCPSDAVPFQTATTPVEAARHFAMKWQLEAAQKDDEELASASEELFKRIDSTTV